MPHVAISRLAAEVRQYAADLQKAATGNERKGLEAERRELADRATPHSIMPTIKNEIARLQSIRFLENCLANTSTNAITTLGNRIADQVLTPRLPDRFFKEIIDLVGSSIRVEMVRAGGQYGSPQYQIRLLAKPDAKREYRLNCQMTQQCYCQLSSLRKRKKHVRPVQKIETDSAGREWSDLPPSPAKDTQDHGAYHPD